MNQSSKDRLSFIVMAVLVFVGWELLGIDFVKTGPHIDLTVGFAITTHDHGNTWSVTSFSWTRLVADMSVALLLTWVMAKIVTRDSSRVSRSA